MENANGTISTEGTNSVFRAAAQSVMRVTKIWPPSIDGLENDFEPIGSGSFGEVWQVTQSTTKRRVAVKFVLRRLDNQGRKVAVQQLRREARLLAKFSHPNIPQCFQANDSEEEPFLIQEYIDFDPDTKSFLTWMCGKPTTEKLKKFTEICEAVAHAHSNQVIHADISPQNVVVDKYGKPWLFDFGVSLEDESNPVQTGRPRSRSAPEQISKRNITAQTDVFLLGVFLHEIVSGEKPFGEEGDDKSAYEERIKTSPKLSFIPTKGLLDYQKVELQSLVQKCLRCDPKDRYSDVRSLINDIEAFLEHRAVKARQDIGTIGRTIKTFRRFPFQTLSAGVTAITLIAASVYSDRKAHQATVAEYEANRAKDIAVRRTVEFEEASTKALNGAYPILRNSGGLSGIYPICEASIDYYKGKKEELTPQQKINYLRFRKIRGMILTKKGEAEIAVKELTQVFREINSLLTSEFRGKFLLSLAASSHAKSFGGAATSDLLLQIFGGLKVDIADTQLALAEALFKVGQISAANEKALEAYSSAFKASLKHRIRLSDDVMQESALLLSKISEKQGEIEAAKQYVTQYLADSDSLRSVPTTYETGEADKKRKEKAEILLDELKADLIVIEHLDDEKYQTLGSKEARQKIAIEFSGERLKARISNLAGFAPALVKSYPVMIALIDASEMSAKDKIEWGELLPTIDLRHRNRLLELLVKDQIDMTEAAR